MSKNPKPIRPKEKSPGWVIWVGAAAVVVVALIAAVALSGREDAPPIEDETGVVAVGPTTTAAEPADEPDGTGTTDTTSEDGQTETTDPADATTTTAPAPNAADALPPFESEAGDPAVGMALPELHGSDVRTGNPVSIEDDGKGKIIVVMAHWCPHCQREIPAIVDHLADAPLPDGVDIYGVSTGVSRDGANYPPSRWLDREDWDHPTIADSLEGHAAGAIGTTGFPYFVVVDPTNTVVARASGEVPMETFDRFIALASGGNR